MEFSTLFAWLADIQVNGTGEMIILGATAAGLLIAAQVAFKIRRRLRRAAASRRSSSNRKPVRADMVATVLAAGLILGLSVRFMYGFFGAIGIHGPERLIFCAVLEICLLAVALRSRHIRLLRQERKDALKADQDRIWQQVADGEIDAETGADKAAQIQAQLDAIRLRGVNDVLVWVLAVIIGVLSAWEATMADERLVRFLVPIIAATMWELALGADVEDQRVSAVALTWIDHLKTFFRYWLVKLHLVPPTKRDAKDEDREQRLTKLVSVSHKLHTLDQQTEKTVSSADRQGLGKQRAKLATKQRKHILDLQARGQWTPDTLLELAQRLDAVYRAIELTAPAKVRALVDHATAGGHEFDWTADTGEIKAIQDAAGMADAPVSPAPSGHQVSAQEDGERPLGTAHVNPVSARSERSVSAPGERPSARVSAPGERPSARTERPAVSAQALGEDAEGGTKTFVSARGTKFTAPSKVPAEAAVWIVEQWESGEDVKGPKVAEQFEVGHSTGRRYLSELRAHNAELCEQLQIA